MRLQSFVATNVNDYLNFDIDFNPEITFLIGINGSGKTTALKLILGLLSPSFIHLNNIQFDSATIVILSDIRNRRYTISAIRKENIISLKLKSKKQPEVENEFAVTDREIGQYENIQEVNSEKFTLLLESFSELEVVKEIRELMTPIFLGLDRRIYEGKIVDRHRFHFHNVPRHYKKRRGSTLDGLNRGLIDVVDMIYDFHRRIGARQPKLTEKFKNKILKSSFGFVESSIFGDNIDLKKSDLTDKRKKVETAIGEIQDVDLKDDIKTFFDKIIDTLERVNNLKGDEKNRKDYLSVLSDWYINSPQIKRIDQIIKYSQEYQRQVSLLKEPVKRLEQIISEFFVESGKKLEVAPDGDLNVTLPNGKPSSVFSLSSGEKQIVIMIAHLIFYEDRKQPGVFIIDEPELSLHLAWQEIFVKSVMKASPKTQFVLATHSPAIIGSKDNEQFCQDLSITV